MVVPQVVTQLPVVVAAPRIFELAELHLLTVCLLLAVVEVVAVADVNPEPLPAVPVVTEVMVLMVPTHRPLADLPAVDSELLARAAVQLELAAADSLVSLVCPVI
jgi:hypothetical protein